jgi:hypothetical protein
MVAPRRSRGSGTGRGARTLRACSGACGLRGPSLDTGQEKGNPRNSRLLVGIPERVRREESRKIKPVSVSASCFGGWEPEQIGVIAMQAEACRADAGCANHPGYFGREDRSKQRHGTICFRRAGPTQARLPTSQARTLHGADFSMIAGAPEREAGNSGAGNLAIRRPHARSLAEGQALRLRRVCPWENPDGLLLPVAKVAADVVCSVDFWLIRAHEGSACSLLFLDRTKGHGRRWPSMAVCTNRPKAAAHRGPRRYLPPRALPLPPQRRD